MARASKGVQASEASMAPEAETSQASEPTTPEELERLIRQREQVIIDEQQAAVAKAAEEAHLEAELVLEDQVSRFKRETPEGLDCYRVNPDQPKNVVLRGQCFQPGNLLRARSGELVDHQLEICTKV
jgi:hypothetical protein